SARDAVRAWGEGGGDEKRVNSTRRIISAAGRPAEMTVDSPAGPSRWRREMTCVAMRGSSRSRYGKRRRTLRLIPPPHGLLRGNADRSMRRTLIPPDARVRAAVAPAGPAPTTITESPGGRGDGLGPGTRRF